MSQAKVDRYKEQKANRKEIAKKERNKRMFRKSLGLVIGLAIGGWIGYSGYELYLDSIPRNVVEVDYNAVQNYVSQLGQVTAEEVAE